MKDLSSKPEMTELYHSLLGVPFFSLHEPQINAYLQCYTEILEFSPFI